MDAVEIRTIAKVTKRLVPFLIICYVVAYPIRTIFTPRVLDRYSAQEPEPAIQKLQAYLEIVHEPRLAAATVRYHGRLC
jgi:hypothetical protein